VAKRTWYLNPFDHATTINPFQSQRRCPSCIHDEHEKRNPVIRQPKKLADADQGHSYDHTTKHSEGVEGVQSLALPLVNGDDARKIFAAYANCVY